MLSHEIDTVVVGGGQAGLAISYYLSQEGREHVVLERAPAVANAWRNQRWDSFTLVTPNFQVRMPGAEYNGTDPYGFMSLAEVVKYFDDYVERFRLSVHCEVEVFSVEKMQEEYLVRTSEGDYQADNVVIATGLYQSPKIPHFSTTIPADILQIHSMEYRNLSYLRDGAVLVVGTGQSGAQIAEEIYQSGRRVYLSIGSAGRVPRRRFALPSRSHQAGMPSSAGPSSPPPPMGPPGAAPGGERPIEGSGKSSLIVSMTRSMWLCAPTASEPVASTMRIQRS